MHTRIQCILSFGSFHVRSPVQLRSLLVINPREPGHDCLSRFRQVGGGLGLLPCLLESREFCLLSMIMRGWLTHHPWWALDDLPAQIHFG